MTSLLQRNRSTHPTAGLYEAADFQWWWRMPRPTDELPQLFWFDRLDRPEAALIATHWGDRVALDAVTMPDATADWIARVIDRGLEHAEECRFDTTLAVEVGGTDDAQREAWVRHGFAVDEGGVVESWITADARPSVSPLHGGYRLANRVDSRQHPHHMIRRNRADVEERLRQTSLYRPDLDLVIYDDSDGVAAYGLFWYDPSTATGLVEPMRTEDEHQRRGLARHVLTAGLDLLAKAGAQRVKICYEPDNPASSTLYLDVGFAPDRETIVLTRR